MEYTKYNPSTGQIESVGILQMENVQLYQPCLLGIRGDFQTQYVNVESETLVNKPTRPSDHHQFNYQSKTWEFDEVSYWADVRKQRDRLLMESDWTQLPDNPLSAEQRLQWASYRQQLRDLTSQPVGTIEWPEKPQ